MKLKFENDEIEFKLEDIKNKALIPVKADKPLILKSGIKSIVNREIPKEAGIYFLFDDQKKLLYIGQSLNLRNRISIHISDNLTTPVSNLSSVDVSYAYYQLIENKIDRNIIEALYIYFYNPPYNSTKFNKTKN